MLKSRHIFIQKGSLSSNDNGRKKFNSSEIRYADEKFLESPECCGDSLPFCMEITAEKLLRQKLIDKMSIVNDMLHSIKKEEKVLIYGGGELAQFLLRYADIEHLNLIGIVDRNRNPVFDIDVKDTTYENLVSADVIIVTPHYAANEIKSYLQSLQLKSRIICLSDLCDGVILTGYENIWAPDLEQKPEEACPVDVDELERTIKTVNRNSPFFVSVKKHVGYNRQFLYTKELEEFEEKTAIVIQGPVVYQQDFTYESIKLYHRNFPKMQLILSVWEDEKVESMYPDISDYNVAIVYSSRPEKRGYQNINLQLTTSYAGITRAKELGCEYVFKTRTDMRFYSPDMTALMYWYMKSFPVADSVRQKARLVIFPPRYDYFFFIRDFFMFGHVDDMCIYWDADRGFSDQYVGESAETMLGNRYAFYMQCQVENNLCNIEQYKTVITKLFAVVDDKLLDYVWYKYFYNKLWEHEYHYNVFNFADWIACLKQNNIDEKKLQQCVKKTSDEAAKKVLFYISDIRMASKYLQTVNLTNVCLRLVRGEIKGGNTSLYAEVLFVEGKNIEVHVLQEGDYQWADEIWFLNGESASMAVIKKMDNIWKSKIRLLDNPYVNTIKTYTNAAGEYFEIWERFAEVKDTKYKLEDKDIPFVFEPRLASINKSQTEEYCTYSIGRKNELPGLYFDEEKIARQKGYSGFNCGTEVILYGMTGDSDFLRESLQFFRYLYGEKSVRYVACEKKNDTLSDMLLYISENYMQDDKSYVLMPADVRVISPYMVKLFHFFGAGKDESIGVVQPYRKGLDISKLLLYGGKMQVVELAGMLKEEDWYNFVMEKCIVFDYEMLNVIDCEREVYSCADKERYIGFVEWVNGRSLPMCEK